MLKALAISGFAVLFSAGALLAGIVATGGHAADTTTTEHTTITETAPNANTFGTTASGGTYSCLVSAVNGKPNPKINVTYVVTATDAAGNTSAATTVNFADSR